MPGLHRTTASHMKAAVSFDLQRLRRDLRAVDGFNAKLAVVITRAVGTMWCAYAFALFDLISLPASIHAGTLAIVSWVAQTFLQLVLLAVIMVGQNVQAVASDAREEKVSDHMDTVVDRLDTSTKGGLAEVIDENAKGVKTILSAISNGFEQLATQSGPPSDGTHTT